MRCSDFVTSLLASLFVGLSSLSSSSSSSYDSHYHLPVEVSFRDDAVCLYVVVSRSLSLSVVSVGAGKWRDASVKAWQEDQHAHGLTTREWAALTLQWSSCRYRSQERDSAGVQLEALALVCKSDTCCVIVGAESKSPARSIGRGCERPQAISASQF